MTAPEDSRSRLAPQPFTLPLWLSVPLLLGLLMYGADTALHAVAWPGQLGGVLGAVLALYGVVFTWRRRAPSAPGAFFGAYVLMKAWARLDPAAANGTLAGRSLIWPVLLSLLVGCWLVFSDKVFSDGKSHPA